MYYFCTKIGTYVYSVNVLVVLFDNYARWLNICVQSSKTYSFTRCRALYHHISEIMDLPSSSVVRILVIYQESGTKRPRSGDPRI